jgi:hypothetical protein
MPTPTLVVIVTSIALVGNVNVIPNKKARALNVVTAAIVDKTKRSKIDLLTTGI